MLEQTYAGIQAPELVGSVLISAVVPARCTDLFEPQARRDTNQDPANWSPKENSAAVATTAEYKLTNCRGTILPGASTTPGNH